MVEYFNNKNLAEAVSGVREMKAPKHFLPEMLSKIIVCSLDRPDEDKEHASTLIHTLRTEGLVSGENFMQVSTPADSTARYVQQVAALLVMLWWVFCLARPGFPQRAGPVP